VWGAWTLSCGGGASSGFSRGEEFNGDDSKKRWLLSGREKGGGGARNRKGVWFGRGRSRVWEEKSLKKTFAPVEKGTRTMNQGEKKVQAPVLPGGSRACGVVVNFMSSKGRGGRAE